MFGQTSFTRHPQQTELLNAISKRARHPQKLRSPSLLAKGVSIITPRFGGRAIYLWVKNKTQVWIDRKSVWASQGTFPRSFLKGTLLQAELYKCEHTGWVVAFEDLLIADGTYIYDTTPFPARLKRMISLVTQLRHHSDPSHSPGAFTVKPWTATSDAESFLDSAKYYKQPTHLLLRFLQRNPKSKRPDNGLAKDPFFFRIRDDPEKDSVFKGLRCTIRTIRDTAYPDQYDLYDTATAEYKGRACVRTIQNSLWLRGVSDHHQVWCRWLKEHSGYEPYADAIDMCV